MNLTDLETFVHVADQGTMSGAAERLGVPTSTVSRRVSRLEDALGMALLRRAHRSFTLTEHGQHLFTRCAPLFTELDTVLTALTDQSPEPRGLLRVTAPQDLGAAPFVADTMARFMERWPEVVLDVTLTNRRVMLAEEGYDVGLRAHGPQIPGGANLMVRRLGVSPMALFAAPSYLDRRGDPEDPGELAAHRCVSNTLFGGVHTWELAHDDQERSDRIVVEPTLESNDFNLLLAMALAGSGICVLPLFLAGPLMRQGLLTRVLPEWSLPGGHMSLLWPQSRHLAPRVRTFIDFMADAFANNCDFKN